MVDGGIGISAAVAIGAKFIERSKFTARHDGVYDKESEKRVRLAERFEKIPKEDVDHFEWEEYNSLHARSLQDLRIYKDTQDEYKSKEWYKQPVRKYRTRGRVREAKRQLQSSIVTEGLHIEELEAHSRSNSSRCSSVGSFWDGSESGLDLGRSRPYRTDSCSLRATGGSPPSASLDDINSDEQRQEVTAQVSDWLSSMEAVDPPSPSDLDSRPATADIDPTSDTVFDSELGSQRSRQDYSPTAASQQSARLGRPASRSSDAISMSSSAIGTGTGEASKSGLIDAQNGLGNKFTLKALLQSEPKLRTRKTSQRSRLSRQSGSGAKETIDVDQKYQKVKVGNKATTLVISNRKSDPSGKFFALKGLRKRRRNETQEEYLKNITVEFIFSSTMIHSNVLETIDMMQDENHLWFEVVEFCPGGDLYDAIKAGGMSESEVKCCFKQIVNGVSYLHSQGIAHRDLKPENLFFDAKGCLKISDFSAATDYRLPWETTVHMSKELCGSEPYIAPELFLGEPYDPGLGDIWSCGILYYCLYFQELPWRGAQTLDPLYRSFCVACASPDPAVSTCPPTIKHLGPPECRSLLRKMLEPEPRSRFTIEDVVVHEWLQSFEVCHEVQDLTHTHTHARKAAAAYFPNGEDGNGIL